jgi:transcriptional regulator with XRE-family HTH domain
MQNSRLGASILNRRRALGLTQQQLADQVGVHQTRVSHWERGSRAPSADQLQALAAVFSVDLKTLVAEYVVDNEVERALVRDPLLSDDDRNALLTIYRGLTQRPLMSA